MVAELVIALEEGALSTAEPWDPCSGEAGALVCFDGVVRRMEGEASLLALDYEAYEPMTTRELRVLAEAVSAEFPGVLAMAVTHSVGRVPVGAVSFRLRVASVHRKEGLMAMDAFIDRMKQVVPLWKVAVEA